MFNFWKKIAAGALSLFAGVLTEHRTEWEPAIDAAGVQGVDALVTAAETADEKFGPVATMFNGFLNEYKAEIEAAIPQFEGTLFDKLVGAIKSVAATLSA